MTLKLTKIEAAFLAKQRKGIYVEAVALTGWKSRHEK